MKRFFTYAAAACLAMTAWAQDTSEWENGQDVTDLLQWKATKADEEDIENPAWQGFQYGTAAPSTWEFRDGSGGERDTYHSWGVYNVETWNVYQEFEIPAGVYTVKLAGAYREGDKAPTFDKWLSGEPTKNAFLYVTVGEKTFQTPMMYFFTSGQTTQLFQEDSWKNDGSFTNPKDGVIYYCPSCHEGADKYLEAGHWNYNEVLFIVPETQTIRVGINKSGKQTNDQVWWNEWQMIYEMPYDPETAEQLIAYDNYTKAMGDADNFTVLVSDEYPTLSSIMSDALYDIDDQYNITASSSLAEIEAAIDAVEKAHADNKKAYSSTKTMEFVIGVCEGIAEVTNFNGKDDLQTAINYAKSVLYDDQGEYTVADYLAAGDGLNKARIAYLLTQDKDKEGAYDFTHAISNPWFVNQEYTPTYNASNDTYVYPAAIESSWFGNGAPGDENDVETATEMKEGVVVKLTNSTTGEEVIPIASKAHWSSDPNTEERWVYEDKWAGWHGGMKNCIQKLKGYTAFYSGWAAGANINGGMWVTQVLNDLPEGLYTLEGRVFISADGFADQGNQYMFMNDADGNELVKVKNTTSKGFWDFWGRDGWVKLTTDFFYVPGGKVKVGYHHNSMAGNTGMVLKYYGTELDYNLLAQNKIDENKPAADDLWAGDLATYNAMVAEVQFPIANVDAYTVAIQQINAAAAFKNTASAAKKAYNVPDLYMNVYNSEYTDNSRIGDIIFHAWDSEQLGYGANDSYTMIDSVKAIYNAYISYVAKFASAETYATDYAAKYPTETNDINNKLSAQFADLSENYSNVATLNAYESELATIINSIIFKDRGADQASEENPLDITDMLNNADLSEGPKTGWTLEGEDCNPSINTYGRGLAECWNQKPFVISQTLRSLPAGNYVLSVRACYRDGSPVDQAMVDRAKAGNKERLYAYLFEESDGRTEQVQVTSTAEGEWTTPSFDHWWNAKGSEEAQNAGYMSDWDGAICILPGEESVLNEDDLIDALKTLGTPTTVEGVEYPYGDPATVSQGEHYPMDTKVGDNWYPASMCGFKLRIEQSADAYVNEVRIYVEEGKDLKLGLKKIDAVGNDWLIYDDFKLFYLGNVVPTEISNVNVNEEKAQPTLYFNAAGVQVDKNYKGFVFDNKGNKFYNNK